MASDSRAFAFAFALACITAAGTTRADAPIDITPTMRDTARARMEKGRTLRAEGNERAALEAFQQAHALVPVPTTALEVARSLDALQRYVEARDVLLAIRRMPVAPNEPPPFVEARRAAAQLDRVVDAKIGTLRIEARDAGDGWTAKLDDTPIPIEALEEGVRANPGEHVVTFARGDAKVQRTVAVSPAATAVLVVDLPRTVDEAPARSSTTPPREPEGNTRRTLLIGSAVVAGLGVVVAAGGTTLALTSKPDCPNDRCPPDRHADVDRATTWANVGTGGAIVAGIGLATFAIVWLFTSPSPSVRAAH